MIKRWEIQICLGSSPRVAEISALPHLLRSDEYWAREAHASSADPAQADLHPQKLPFSPFVHTKQKHNNRKASVGSLILKEVRKGE